MSQNFDYWSSLHTRFFILWQLLSVTIGQLFTKDCIAELISLHFPFFFSILLVSSFIDRYLNQITPQCVLVLSW